MHFGCDVKILALTKLGITAPLPAARPIAIRFARLALAILTEMPARVTTADKIQVFQVKRQLPGIAPVNLELVISAGLKMQMNRTPALHRATPCRSRKSA